MHALVIGCFLAASMVWVGPTASPAHVRMEESQRLQSIPPSALLTKANGNSNNAIEVNKLPPLESLFAVGKREVSTLVEY